MAWLLLVSGRPKRSLKLWLLSCQHCTHCKTQWQMSTCSGVIGTTKYRCQTHHQTYPLPITDILPLYWFF